MSRKSKCWSVPIDWPLTESGTGVRRMENMNFSDIFKNLGGMKSKMEEAKKRIERISVTGEAGAGMVSAKMDGSGKVTSINVDQRLLDPKEKDLMEELVVSAINDAQMKMKEAVSHEIRSATGMDLPGLGGMFG
ncbi:MAG: YbaB/EbfC family nucleoid-associated protein [Leptospiraceae bacterium]|nr:YbaB/EbfC family nucleoid-associated protein [Leptospiraceae bacterium]